MAMLLAVLLAACNNDNDNTGEIAPVSQVTATSFIGSVILNWQNPGDADLYYILVAYTDAQGNRVQKKIDRYATDSDGKTGAIIGGFTDTNEYRFSLTAHGYSGASSVPVEVSGTPSSTTEAKDYVIKTVTVETATSGAKVSWVNETGVGVTLTASYTDYKQRKQVVQINATATGSKLLDKMEDPTDIQIVATNIEGGEKSEVKSFAVTPYIDPDDRIQEGIDYITLKTGNTNQMTVSQDNEDNPYEYTFATTGGDPNIPCNGMPKPIPGKTLVFRYQTSAAFAFEIFWCNAGGGAAGGRSTTVNVPANPEGEWATFRYDYTEAMAKHSWKGDTGDFMRFDLGNKSGVNIQMKNIHFE